MGKWADAEADNMIGYKQRRQIKQLKIKKDSEFREDMEIKPNMLKDKRSKRARKAASIMCVYVCGGGTWQCVGAAGHPAAAA